MTATNTKQPHPPTTVVTRFAPSPSGHLHIGGARTALFCWAYAKRHAGRFLLRIEDTDTERSSEAAAQTLLHDLAWLGIHWDDGPTIQHNDATIGGDTRNVGPFHQSKRASIYQQHIDQLLQQQRAYPAFETAGELNAMRERAHAEKRTFRYTQPPNYQHAAAMQRAADGEPHVLRLRVDDTTITVHDEVMGDITFTTEHFDDFVIRKKDGNPTYHFAVVIDDAHMGVTHVLRGQEHLNNTPKHVAIQRALDLPTPVYAHMPLIFNEKGAKMSKRERDVAAKAACRDANIETSPAPDTVNQDTFSTWLTDKKAQLQPAEVQAIADALGLDLPEVSVDDFRRAGYLPNVINNHLALLGWSIPEHARADLTDPDTGNVSERFDADFLAAHLELKDLGKSNARFDRAKLLAFNADTIQHTLTDADFAQRWLAWLREHEPATLDRLEHAVGPDRWPLLATAAKPRAKTLRDAIEPVSFVLLDDHDIQHDEKAAKKALLKGEPSGLDMLPELRERLQHADDAFAIATTQPDALDAVVKDFCEQRSIGMGKAAQPLRVAVTGTAVSPPLGQTLALLGKQRTLARIDHALESFAPPAPNPTPGQ